MMISKWQCPGCGKVLTESTNQPLKKRTVDEFHIVRCKVFEEKYGIPDYLQDYKAKVRSQVGTFTVKTSQTGAGSVLQHDHYG